MQIEPLDLPGAWLCTHEGHVDDRGTFGEWFRPDLLAEATGREFTVRQGNHVVSARGVVRGVHFSRVPPGQAKYVYCTSGSILDIVVDLRDGSPTFGAHSALTLTATNRRAVFVAEGLGHAYLALEEATVAYLVSETYAPQHDGAVHPFDAELALPWGADPDSLILSPADRDAPDLATAKRDGLLPSYLESLTRYEELATP